METGNRVVNALVSNRYLNALFRKANCNTCEFKRENHFSARLSLCTEIGGKRSHELTDRLAFCDIKNPSGQCLGYSPQRRVRTLQHWLSSFTQNVVH
jgi:hypothetical protein